MTVFQEAIRETTVGTRDDDLGRLVIQHPSLDSTIVVSIRFLHQFTAESVMEVIQNVLNSNQGLVIDDSFLVTIGIIRVFRGGAGGHTYITCLNGRQDSAHVKKSIIKIVNNDNMCLARSIAVSYGKVHCVSNLEWRESTEGLQGDAISLALQCKKLSPSLYNHLREKNRQTQTKFALKLCELADVDPELPASLNDIPKFEAALDVYICVVSASLGNKFIRVPQHVDRVEDEHGLTVSSKPFLYVYHVECPDGTEHFHTIASIAGFFNSSYFCQLCLKAYDHKNRHACLNSCMVCESDQCPVTNNEVPCTSCNRTCRSMTCFNRHLEVKKSKKAPVLSPCQRWHKCITCKKVLDVTKRDPRLHKCGEWFCRTCTRFVTDKHFCFQRAASAQDTSTFRHMYFDFECRQDSMYTCAEGYSTVRCTECIADPCPKCSACINCSDPACGKYTHTPNFVVCQKVCNACQYDPVSEKCSVCGDRCSDCGKWDRETKTYVSALCDGCGGRERIFEGDQTADEFGQYLFQKQHKDSTVLAHNMKGYDGYFILQYLISQSVYPQNIIYSGSKIMYLHVGRGLNIRIIDSLNFLPMKLSALPKAFGLTELKKGWFPHYFNTRDNQNYVGPFPSKRYYGYNMMSVEERQNFVRWHVEQTHEFDFRQEIHTYCVSDVAILREACMRYRTLMIGVTKGDPNSSHPDGRSVDPFRYTTIASVCMGVFKTKFMNEHHEAVLLHKATRERRKTDVLVKDGQSLYFINDIPTTLEDLSRDWDVEKKARFVKSDIACVPSQGYCIDQYSDISIKWLEYLNQTLNLQIQHALNKGEYQVPNTKFKADGFDPLTNTIYEFHGCLFHGCRRCFQDRSYKHPLTKQSSEELYVLTQKKQTFIKSKGYKYVCMWECDFKREMVRNKNLSDFVKYVDIQPRLNPRDSFFGGRTNASKLYHRVSDGEKIKYVDFTSLYPYVNKYGKYPIGHPQIITQPGDTDLSRYFGIAKVKILPPTGLYHPVLPYRSVGKLKFPLCRTCADKERTRKCQCSLDERVLIGTWCTPELNKAVEKGYVILSVYEIYNWKETSQYDKQPKQGGLFTEYINMFLKIKQQASGWPDWCVSETDKQKYINDYFEYEGIKMDYEDIEKNPGLRSLAKLCLNSFWGKFGQRLNLPQSVFIHDSQAERFFSLFSDPMKIVTDFHIVNDHVIHVKYEHTEDYCAQDVKTNIFLATFTTCWARLKLYDVLDKLQRNVLYYDTDSVVYVSRPGQYDPPLGDYLGQLTDELGAGQHIVEFVSGGPKNYCFKTSNGSKTCKVRGFTLNFTNSQKINFDSIKEMVTQPGGMPSISTVNTSKISRDPKTTCIYNRVETKRYKVVYTKRVIQEDLDTLPYGY